MCDFQTSTSDDFWILARALKDFVEDQGENGSLPLRGSIQDMFSYSKRYIQLQNIYRDRANADAEEVFKSVQNHLEAIGRQPVRYRMCHGFRFMKRDDCFRVAFDHF